MADKTTGGLKAVEEVSIGDLPGIVDLYDDSLIPVEQQGEARHMTGRQWRQYASVSIAHDVNAAKESAEAAAKSAASSIEAAARAEAAIQRPAVPDPDTGNWLVWDQTQEAYVETVPPVRAEGRDFEIKGYYPSLEALEAAVPEPKAGYAYGVGESAPYDIYVWDAVSGKWKNNGPMTASGDMLKSLYDPEHREQDIFAYADRILQSALDADVGRSMAGKTVEPSQGTTVTAETGAEIFNDYRVREFLPTGYIKCGNVASGEYSNAEGSGTTASGRNAHAEGSGTTASGESAHAEGSGTTASGRNAHAEGHGSVATGNYAHAEGYLSKATGGVSGRYVGAHAEGFSTTASAQGAHAEGQFSEAKGDHSHAGGNSTIAAASAQTAIGSYNIERSDFKDTFIIGKGSTGSRANCFRVNHTGVYASGNYNASGADYAELFEWADGNPEASDRAGRFVTLTGGKIRLAGPGDGYILGLVSGNPSVVGDVYDDQWQGMYLTDVFGRPLWEDVEVPAVTEEVELPVDIPGGDSEPRRMEIRKETRVIIPAHTERRQKLNPDYDPTQAYVPRSQRPEWAAVGMLGKLVALEDGTCRVDGWAAVGEGGVAVGSEEWTKYRVMEKLTDPETGRKCVRILIM